MRSRRAFAAAWALAGLTAAASQAGAAPPDRESAVREALERHPYFRTIRYTVHAADEPFVLVVQERARDPELHEDRMRRLLEPWIRELGAVFRRDLAEPLALAPRPGAHVLAVLASQGDYVNYGQKATDRALMDAVGHYDRSRGLCAGYAVERGPDHVRRFYLLRQVARSLVDAHAAGDRGLGAGWFLVGLADHLAYHTAGEPDRLGDRPLDAPSARLAARLYVADGRRDVYLLALDDLLDATGPGAAPALAQEKSAALGLGDADPPEAYQAFVAQAYLFTRFLEQREPELFRRFARRAFAEGPTRAVFLDELGVDRDPAGLERAFWQFVLESAEEAGTADRVVARRADLRSGGARSATAGAAPVVPLRVADPVQRLGTAVVLAAHGAVDHALREVETLAEVVGDGPDAERVALERDRLAAWVALRDAWLAELSAEGGRLRVEIGGRRLSAVVAAVEEGRVVFAEAARGRDGIAVEELTPLVVARALGSDVGDHGPEWLRLWAHAVAGDDRWEGILKRDRSPEVEALRADAEGFYPRAREEGRIVFALDDLDAAGPPDGLAAALEARARIEDLLAEHRDHPLVAEREDALRGRARAALALEAEDRELSDLVAASVESTGGRVRLTWDFESAAQLSDFVPSELLSGGRRRDGLETLGDPHPFRVEDGALVALGQQELALGVPIAPPWRVDLRFRMDVSPTAPLSVLSVFAGHVDGGLQLVADSGGRMWSILPSGPVTVDPDVEPSLPIGSWYDFELAHDVEEVVLRVDRNDTARGPASPGDGRSVVGLQVLSEVPVSVDDLRVEGAVADGALPALRARWVERRLAELGLGAGD